MARITVSEVVRILNVQSEAVMYACNRIGIAVSPAGEFDYPAEGPLCKRWHSLLASRPSNLAERLRQDLGAPVRRVV